MKKDTLKVGTSKGEFYVEVEVNMPETLRDCGILAKIIDDAHLASLDRVDAEGDKAGVGYMVAKFTRGYRIDLQEGGARQALTELLGGKSAAQAMKDAELLAKAKKVVQDEIAAFDPAAPRARGGRKATPQTVTIDPNKTYSAAELQALLASVKGISVVTE